MLASFSDPKAVERYTDGPRQYLPGLDGLHRMTEVLLAERVPENARILVLGAGGGLELKALAAARPGWTVVGVDPARAMLDVAVQTLGPLAERVELVEGYIDAAPPGPFDGAVCLLVLHFLEPAERQRTERAIRERLVPGAPFVAAHGSLTSEPSARERVLARYRDFAIASGADPEQAERFRAGCATSAAVLTPEQDEEILRAAGFTDVTPVFHAFSWRGWVAHA